MGHLLKVRIREAATSDINPFWNFFVKSIKTQFPEYSLKAKNYFLQEHYTKENFKKWLKRKEKTLLIALNKKEIIGYLLASPPYGGVAFIIWLAVKTTFQKKGVGNHLLKSYEIIAKKQKAHKVYL